VIVIILAIFIMTSTVVFLLRTKIAALCDLDGDAYDNITHDEDLSFQLDDLGNTDFRISNSA